MYRYMKNCAINWMLNISLFSFLYHSPAEELEFVVEDETSEAFDNIILKNTLPYSIAFKVTIPHLLHLTV